LAVKYGREKIGEGIHYTTLINKRQKTNTMFIHLITPLSQDSVSGNAVIPYVLSNSSSSYTTVTALSRRLALLYGSVIKGSVAKIGDSQVMSLVSGCINDRYAFDREPITSELTEILTNCFISPYVENNEFYKKDFDLKKQELSDDIEAEINEKRSYSFKRAGLVIYEGEPCAIPVKGDLEAVAKITARSAYEQYKELLKTAQIEAYFVGGAECPQSKEVLTAALTGLERDYAGDNISEKSPAKQELRRVVEQHEVSQSKMLLGFKTDFSDSITLRLMNAVFGGTPFSKLFLNVRERLSLCYYCSSGLNDKKGVVYVDSGVDFQNAAKAEEEILNQLSAVQSGNFTTEELENARLSVINTWRGVSDGARSLADWYFQRNYSGGNESPEECIEMLRLVTKEDVVEAAKSLKLDTAYLLTGKENT